MKAITSILKLLILVFLVASCDYSDVKYKGIENFKLGKLEGKKVTLSADVILDNPNSYSIKIKPSTLDLYINDVQMGEVHLDEKVKIVKKAEQGAHTQATLTLSDGMLMKLIAIATKPSQLSVRIKGKVKGTVGLVSKKIDIDETKSINLKDFNLDGLNLPFLK